MSDNGSQRSKGKLPKPHPHWLIRAKVAADRLEEDDDCEEDG